jgi:hypothetical protein
VAPLRGTFARIGDELGQVRGLEPDSERHFDRIGDQIDRLVDAIDASTCEGEHQLEVGERDGLTALCAELAERTVRSSA